MAIEQNEIKKVITVDLGNSETKLKDYKKHIDDLRGSLLQLDKTSEEYKTISKEIEAEQAKLNEVMKVGKGITDAAEGSYNQLSQTMSELKKQWKATADEAERAELGKQILDINNQLKELDASTGNFQRNVGDYANAFEQAFDKCLDGINNIDGPLGELGGTVKNMLPVIKSINKTAISGLDGIKKGIAATGIGVLVIAVATLMQHWEDLTKIIGVSQTSITEFKEKSLDTLQSIVIGTFGVGNALGNFLLAPIRTIIEAVKGLGTAIKSVFSGDFSKAVEDAKTALSNIGNVWNKAFDFSVNMGIGKEIGYQFTERIRQVMSSPETEEAVEEAGTNIGKTYAKGIEKGVKNEITNVQKSINDFMANAFKTMLNYSIEELKDEASRRSDWLKNAIQDAVDEANQEKFELKYSANYDTMTIQERADAEYEIERKLIEDKIALQQTYLDNFIGTQEEKEVELKKLSALQQELDNADLKHTKDTEKRKANIKRREQEALLSSSVELFGALSDLAEEGSEEQKAFSIMQTVLNTLQSIMGIWAGYSEMGPFGIAAAAVQTAAVTATGAATIAKMKSTTKDSASSASVAVPQISTPSMTNVNPLLDEQSDLNRFNMSGMKGNSQEQSNMRVYVVDQDIRDANQKAEVVENNATF
ncbi:MAG: hypothetical protein IIU99_05450 [Treponema sp.]|nr:hypothetical protein [Treponema sp.]